MALATSQLVFLIGLSSPDDPRGCVGWPMRVVRRSQRRRKALALLATRYRSFLALAGRGIWQGSEEPSLEVTVLEQGERLEIASRAKRVARELADALDQDCVGVVCASVSF